MLVSLNPSLSSSNTNKSVNFGKNPYIDTAKISSVAEAYHFERLVDPEVNKIPRTPEEETDLNSAIEQCLKRGKKTVIAILNRAKSQWK